GVLLGIGNSIILYLLIPVVCGRWFAKNVSTLIGIGMAMTGIGGMAWSPVATSIITSSGYHTAYLVYAIVTLVVGLPCAWLIKSYPSDKGLLPIGYDAEEAAKKAEAAKTVVVEGVTAKTALSKPAALVVLMLYCAFVNFGLTMNYYLPTYIKSLSLTGVDVAMVGATLASVVMFGSLIGKLLLGWTNDKSVPGSVIFGLLSGIIGLALVLWGVNISIFLVYVGGALFGVFFASATTTTPAIIRKAFGNLEYTKIYAWVTGICALFAAGGSTIWGLIFDKTGSFTATYLVDMSVMAVCFILAFGGLAMAKKLPRESKQQ
ncbi:MAG: MFS transporter, partial [Eggerthellaceae bacterium]|nr:MFS transporter [Eggerthellaceae bacterium]